MAQTTGANAPNSLEVRYSTDGSTYTDITGSINKIGAPSGFESMDGFAHTGGSTTPLQTVGNYGPGTLPITAIDTTTAGEAAPILRAAWAARTNPFYIRTWPLGKVTGRPRHTYTGTIKGPGIPVLDPATGAPMLAEFTLSAKSLVVDTEP